jgi:hypothetical protein
MNEKDKSFKKYEEYDWNSTNFKNKKIKEIKDKELKEMKKDLYLKTYYNLSIKPLLSASLFCVLGFAFGFSHSLITKKPLIVSKKLGNLAIISKVSSLIFAFLPSKYFNFK